MSIAEKLTTIAENQQRVFDAGRNSGGGGYDEGYSNGYESGYIEGYDSGFNEGYDSGYWSGYDEGQTAEYDRFWDSFQQNGNRTDYQMAITGFWCNPVIFYPKYDIRPKGNATQMIYNWNKTPSIDLSARLEECGVVLDTSEVTNAQYLFGYGTQFTRLPAVDLQKATQANWVFYGCNNLVTIDKITVSATTGIEPDWFGTCYALENVTFDGVIGKSISFSACTKLSKASIESVINHLSTTTNGLTATFTRTSVTNAFGSTTASAWTTLVNSKSNWTISLV